MAISNGSILLNFERLQPEQQHQRVQAFVDTMQAPHEARRFSDRSVSEEVMEKIIHAAGTSPSGANQQPWTFVLVQDPFIKKQLRKAAEGEEKERGKNNETDKAFLEAAPYVVALFKQKYGLERKEDGSTEKVKHYYPNESTAICAGFFIAALQHAGLDYRMHGPVKAMGDLLQRPDNEAPFLLFAVGYAEEQELSKRFSLESLIDGDTNLSFTEEAHHLEKPVFQSDEEQLNCASRYYDTIKRRRNVRDYSTEPVDLTLIQQAFQSVNAAPMLTESQAFRFVLVTHPETKQKIREQAEGEEKKFYEEKITDEWRDVLQPLGTNWQKPHLTDAPYIIAAFKIDDSSSKEKTMPLISTGIAVGILMSALHHAGLCTLTHTPSPMTFLRDLLERPKAEMPIVVLPVGYPATDCEVPDITKKPLSKILVKL
jgi:nitroreductase